MVYGNDFANRGFDDADEIVDLMNKALNSSPIKAPSHSDELGWAADYLLDGKMYKLVWGDNGYIKSFYPISGK